MDTAVLIDGSNIYATAKTLGYSVDYKELSKLLHKQYDIFRIYYFTAIKPDTENNHVVVLADWLEYNGYKTVLKDTKQFTDPISGRVKVKGNMDMEMAVAAYNLVGHVKRIVLFTGDGDFTCLVEDLQNKGIQVVVVSTIATKPPMIADELRRISDVFIDLSTMTSALTTFGERKFEGRTPRFGTKPA